LVVLPVGLLAASAAGPGLKEIPFDEPGLQSDPNQFLIPMMIAGVPSLLRSAVGYIFGGCGCKEPELPPISGGAPAIPPQFPPGPNSLLTHNEAGRLWDYVHSLEPVVQGTARSELAKATDTGPFLGGGYCVDYFRQLAPELPQNASPFELVAQALNNYAGKGAGSNLLKGPVPNVWTFLGRSPPVP
jgi:hypothetical protein